MMAAELRDELMQSLTSAARAMFSCYEWQHARSIFERQRLVNDMLAACAANIATGLADRTMSSAEADEVALAFAQAEHAMGEI